MSAPLTLRPIVAGNHRAPSALLALTNSKLRRRLIRGLSLDEANQLLALLDEVKETIKLMQWDVLSMEARAEISEEIAESAQRGRLKWRRRCRELERAMASRHGSAP